MNRQADYLNTFLYPRIILSEILHVLGRLLLASASWLSLPYFQRPIKSKEKIEN